MYSTDATTWTDYSKEDADKQPEVSEAEEKHYGFCKYVTRLLKMKLFIRIVVGCRTINMPREFWRCHQQKLYLGFHLRKTCDKLTEPILIVAV